MDGVIERRPITPGPIVDGLRVIRKGLEGNETLVIEGLLKARPAMEVTPVDGTIKVVEDGLPHDYKPVPKEEWISPAPAPLPETQSLEAPKPNSARRAVNLGRALS